MQQPDPPARWRVETVSRPRPKGLPRITPSVVEPPSDDISLSDTFSEGSPAEAEHDKDGVDCDSEVQRGLFGPDFEAEASDQADEDP